MKLLLRAFESRESLNGHPVALLELTPEKVGVLRQRREDFLAAKQVDKDLFRLSYHDFSVEGWYEANTNNLGEKLLDEVLEEHTLKVDEFPEFVPDDAIRTDAHVLCVGEAGFYWRCRFKYSVSGLSLETDCIVWERLDDYAEDGPSLPG